MTRPAGRMVRRRALDGAVSARTVLPGLSQRALPRAVWYSLGTFCVDTDEPVLSLTYDDGPHPEHTPRILDVLAEHGASATFFVLDGPARDHAHVLRRIVAEGHEVALHGPNHQSLFTMSTRAARDAVAASRDRIEQLSGAPVALYRPPYGQHTTAQARAIAALGLELAIWSGDAVDWVDDDEHAIAGRALQCVQPGAVLLLHDDRADLDQLRPGDRAPRFDRALVLRHILTEVDARGFSALTMSELLGRGRRLKTIARERTRL